MMKLALIYTQTWLISAKSESQKHLHIIHSEIGLPKHHAPNHLIPKGKMRLAAVKAKKISSKKDVLIVKFIFPSSLENVQIQLFCTSLEPKTKQGQGADLSILTALKITKPGAKSLFDLGVRCKPRSDTTLNMIAAFDSMMGGTIFDARKRHRMTLRHQSKPISGMGAPCDHIEIRWATTKAHPTPNTTVR